MTGRELRILEAQDTDATVRDLVALEAQVSRALANRRLEIAARFIDSPRAAVFAGEGERLGREIANRARALFGGGSR